MYRAAQHNVYIFISLLKGQLYFSSPAFLYSKKIERLICLLATLRQGPFFADIRNIFAAFSLVYAAHFEIFFSRDISKDVFSVR